MERMNDKAETIDEDVMLDIPDVMKILKCSDRHITNLRKNKRIPEPVKIGALVRWPRGPFMEWVNSGCPPMLAV